MNYLFKDFLDDQTIYLQNEAFYKNLFTEIIGEEPVDYYTTHFNNGQKFFDGNPIFNTKKNNRSIRIIQDEPESETPYLHARIEKKEDALEELIINLELSEEIKPVLEIYLKKWFIEKVSLSEIKKLHKKYLIVEENPIVSELKIAYKKTILKKSKGKSKFQIALDLYSREFKEKLNQEVDSDLLKEVTKACGPAIYNKDAARISTSDPVELSRIKKNFLIKRLGLKDSPALDEGIKEVADLLSKGKRYKYRAMFYYLLVREQVINNLPI